MWSWFAGSFATRSRERERGVVELRLRHRLRRQPPLDRPAPVDRVAGQQQPLRALEAEPVHPHRGRRRAPDARGRVADAAVLRADDQVRAEREVGAAADAEAVHLRDHRLRRAPQRHVRVDVARHHLVVEDRVPRARLPAHQLRAPVDVVAGAEGAAGAAQADRRGPRVVLRAVDRRVERLDQLGHDRVQPLGTVERERRDAVVGLEEDWLRVGHSRILGGRRRLLQRAPEDLALVGERLLAQRAGEAGEDLTGQRAAVHRVHPLRIELLQPVHAAPHRLLVGEDPDLAVEAAHLGGRSSFTTGGWSPGWM